MKTLIIPKRWINGYKMLCEFVKREGHARVKYDFVTSDGFKLGSWVRRQRTSYVNGRLTAEQIEALEALPGWNWNTIAYRWDAKYECLRAYAAREGHTVVPARYKTADGAELDHWVATQRYEYRRNNLPAERIKALEVLQGWCWGSLNARQDKFFKLIEEFAAREGHSRPPRSCVMPDGFNLGRKVQNIRQHYKKDLLPAEFVRRLETLPGWTWNVKKAWQQKGYKALLIYTAREGHARVPARYKDSDGFTLGNWVDNNRQQYHHNRLPQLIIDVLEACTRLELGKNPTGTLGRGLHAAEKIFQPEWTYEHIHNIYHTRRSRARPLGGLPATVLQSEETVA